MPCEGLCFARAAHAAPRLNRRGHTSPHARARAAPVRDEVEAEAGVRRDE